MSSRIRQIILVLIMLGTIGIAFNVLFGENTVIFVKRDWINGTNIVWYKYDFYNYIDQLRTNITNTTVLELKIPSLWWSDTDIIHNLSVIGNVLLLVVNILLYPLKIGGYLIVFILSLLGLNITDTSSGVYWLGELGRRLIAIQINYISY